LADSGGFQLVFHDRWGSRHDPIDKLELKAPLYNQAFSCAQETHLKQQVLRSNDREKESYEAMFDTFSIFGIPYRAQVRHRDHVLERFIIRGLRDSTLFGRVDSFAFPVVINRVLEVLGSFWDQMGRLWCFRPRHPGALPGSPGRRLNFQKVHMVQTKTIKVVYRLFECWCIIAVSTPPRHQAGGMEQCRRHCIQAQ
jgi:hypothetical protein